MEAQRAQSFLGNFSRGFTRRNADSDWSAPDYYPVAFIAEHNKILIYHGGADESSNGKYYLLDPAGGKAAEVKGEFSPFRGDDERPLQPTGKPNEYWAATADHEKKESEIGLYDAKLFSFKPLLKLPGFIKSDDLWIDAAERKIYLIYRGELFGEAHLLKFDLPESGKAGRDQRKRSFKKLSRLQKRESA